MRPYLLFTARTYLQARASSARAVRASLDPGASTACTASAVTPAWGRRCSAGAPGTGWRGTQQTASQAVFMARTLAVATVLPSGLTQPARPYLQITWALWRLTCAVTSMYKAPFLKVAARLRLTTP